MAMNLKEALEQNAVKVKKGKEAIHELAADADIIPTPVAENKNKEENKAKEKIKELMNGSIPEKQKEKETKYPFDNDVIERICHSNNPILVKSKIDYIKEAGFNLKTTGLSDEEIIFGKNMINAAVDLASRSNVHAFDEFDGKIALANLVEVISKDESIFRYDAENKMIYLRVEKYETTLMIPYTF